MDALPGLLVDDAGLRKRQILVALVVLGSEFLVPAKLLEPHEWHRVVNFLVRSNAANLRCRTVHEGKIDAGSAVTDRFGNGRTATWNVRIADVAECVERIELQAVPLHAHGLGHSIGNFRLVGRRLTQSVLIANSGLRRIVGGLQRDDVDIEALRTDFLDCAGELVHFDAAARDRKLDRTGDIFAGFHGAVEISTFGLQTGCDVVADFFFEPGFNRHR